jgi:uncharacterized low-complexity protein
MKSKRNRNTVAALAGSAFVTTLGLAGAAYAADTNPFQADDLTGGYLLTAAPDAEGKCGEGKCGAAGDDKDGAEGKCGEGKCGADSDDKDGEGKCGEGKCGGAA